MIKIHFSRIAFKIILFLFIISCNYSYAQKVPLPQLTKGWERIFIKDVGSFDFPPTMEIQEGEYKEFADKIKKEFILEEAQLIIQTKGLNKFTKEGSERYGRIVFQTALGTLGDFSKLDFNINLVSKAEKDELNNQLYSEITEGFSKTSTKILEWRPIKLEKINGMSAIHANYVRQLKNNSAVIVNHYIFFNNDRVHTMTLSHRISEAS
jgi:hypothetical protein